MPRTKQAENSSYYHYRVEYLDGRYKYFLGMKDLCKEFDSSTFTIYRVIKEENFVPRNKKLQEVIISKVYEPVYLKVENPKIIHDVEELELNDDDFIINH